MSLQDVLRRRKMIILKAGEHQIMLNNEALEERESSVIRWKRVTAFSVQTCHAALCRLHSYWSAAGPAGEGGGICSPARASRVALSARQRVNQDRQGFVRTWTSSQPLIRTSKTRGSFLPCISAQHWNSVGIPCHSASSKMGRNPVVRSQATHSSSQRRPWVPAGFSRKQQVKPNPRPG